MSAIIVIVRVIIVFAWRVTLEFIITLNMKAKKRLLRTVQIVAAGLISWALTPQSILPALAFLALLITVCVDLIRHRTSRFTWILTLAFVYVAVGVAHDANVPNYASALCSDGTYSYSAHRSGTCSWHHGVAQWNPRIPPWWWGACTAFCADG